MNVSQRLQAKREAILRVLSVYGASNPRVFGSVVRGEDTEESDLDLLVKLKQSYILGYEIACLPRRSHYEIWK
jgi:predicted nucleotidyltransferase